MINKLINLSNSLWSKLKSLSVSNLLTNLPIFILVDCSGLFSGEAIILSFGSSNSLLRLLNSVLDESSIDIFTQNITNIRPFISTYQRVIHQHTELTDADIDEVLNKLGITDDCDYYIKVKDSYLTLETQLINVDSKRTVYLKDIDRALK